MSGIDPTQTRPSIPLRLAQAYGTQPAAQPPAAPTTPTQQPTEQPDDRVSLAQRLVAATVEPKPSQTPVQPAQPTDNAALPFYTRPADRHAAATRAVLGLGLSIDREA